ncbi:hypothetical protein DVH05_016094 [Phytophthora capsici]|nr:hypothetical protein DVH05_016094 [Phytophthora capsici]
MQPRCYVLFFLLLLVAYSSITSAANATVSVSWTNSTVAGTPELELLLVTGDNPLLPADALFQIQLNSRFAVASDASVDDAVLAESLDSTWSYLVDTKVNTLAVQRSGNGSQLSSGTQIRFKLTGVTNPSRASQFSVGTMQISDHGATFTQLLELQPIEIVPGDLLNSQLSFSNLLSGRSTLLTIHLTVSHSVPHDGAIVVYLPYVYGFLVGVSLSSVVGLDGEIEVSTKDNAIWLKRKAASGTNSGVMQEMVISLAGIVHPKLEGYMGRSVLLQTLDVDTGVIDQAYVDTSDNVLTKAHVVLSSSIVQISEGDLTGAQYTISLSSPPSGDSGLTISIGEIGSSPMLKVDPQLVVFSTANWSSTATITVVASKDVPANETRTQESVAGISHTILSGDSGHTFAAVSELSVRIIDNDFPFQSACFPCPEGFYCPKSSASPVPCANGTYSVNSGTTPCEKCPAGFACSDPTLGPVKCPSGSYSLADSLTCTICPNGKFCPSTDQAPQTCNSGYYSTQGSTLCTTCPRGFQCNGASMSEPVPCAYSTYSSVEGAVMCLPCPVGHSCLDATQPPVLCQPGSFSLDGKGPCTHCPKGYKCATTTDAPVQCVDGTYSPVDAVDCLECPAGKYCPQPSSDPISCSVGYYSVIGSTACIPCPAGMECASPSSIPVECPSGTYTPGPASSCLPCPSGSACANATATPTVCDPGTFSAQGQMKCTQCSAGYYCPQTGQAVQLPCLPGTYAEAGATACTICPAGMQCPSITQAIKEPCKSGTFSLGGQARCIPCPIGHKCPQVDGSLNVVCDPGWYSSGGAVQCTICPAGYACPNPSTSSPVICPDGYYSLTGAKVCVACPAGYACPDPTSKLLVPCAKGTYSTGAASSCTPCPAGFACSFSNSSSVEPCQTGFYSTTGSGSCVECPRGYYCDTPNEMPKNCSLGYYSLRASTSCLACDPGYECPRSDQLPQPCPVGYYSVGAVANCRSCSPGYKCSLASTNPTPKEDACPMGGYCNPPTTFFLCPAGTFGNVTAGEVRVQIKYHATPRH